MCPIELAVARLMSYTRPPFKLPTKGCVWCTQRGKPTLNLLLAINFSNQDDMMNKDYIQESLRFLLS